jgi:hypothetical protein
MTIEQLTTAKCPRCGQRGWTGKELCQMSVVRDGVYIEDFVTCSLCHFIGPESEWIPMSNA